MSTYRFLPLAENPSFGVLTVDHTSPKPAQFIYHNGFSKFRPKREIPTLKLDQFAEMLADGLTVTDAARRMGKDYNYGNAMLQRIRCRLGKQAR